jgi:hypothetical protein
VELRDLIVTPLLLIVVYVVAYFVRPRVTDAITSRYFFPALTLKIFGAIALGFIYQFYYSGGDTFNFHTHGSRHIWQAFVDSPDIGWKMLVGSEDKAGVYRYSSKIPFYYDPSSLFIIRISTLFDLLTFSSYSSTAVFFAVFSFIGAWHFFLVFYKINPAQHRLIAIASLFIPSVVFWGSGLLKDTVTMTVLGVATYWFFDLVIKLRYSTKGVLLLISCFTVMYKVKIYILLTFLPCLILWGSLYHFSKIRSTFAKAVFLPLVLIVAGILAYQAIIISTKDNPKYSLDAIARTAQVTAYDIRYWTGRDAGSGYSLGELDGSWQSMIKLAPKAINVSLFRPYLWEVNNVLMLFSGIEALIIFLLVVTLVISNPLSIWKHLKDPTILFCLLYSLIFAFGVGVATFNFGTLTRYKIPLLPFFVMSLILIYDKLKRDKNNFLLERTE